MLLHWVGLGQMEWRQLYSEPQLDNDKDYQKDFLSRGFSTKSSCNRGKSAELRASVSCLFPVNLKAMWSTSAQSTWPQKLSLACHGEPRARVCCAWAAVRKCEANQRGPAQRQITWEPALILPSWVLPFNGFQWSLFWRKATWQHESQYPLCPVCIWSWINSAHGWDEGGTKEGTWVPGADRPLPWNAGTGWGKGVRMIMNLVAAVKVLIRHLKTKKYSSLGKLSQSY